MQEPAPVWSIWEQGPDRFAERTGQVGHGRVNRDDQVQAENGGRRFSEVCQQRSEIHDALGYFAARDAFLEANELDARCV